MASPLHRPAARLASDLLALISSGSELAAVEAGLARHTGIAVQGVSGAAKVALIAALANDSPNAPLLVVLPDQERARRLADDLGDLVKTREVMVNPSLGLYQLDPATGEVLTSGAVSARLRLLRALGGARPPLIVTGVTALLQQVPAPRRLTSGLTLLEVGAELDPHELTRCLVMRGYSRVQVAEAPGELAIRGGVFDLFPLGEALPLRVELFGDEIESLRRFDPVDQRSVETLTRYELPLLASGELREWSREDRASLIDHLPRESGLVLLQPDRLQALLLQARTRFSGHTDDLLHPSELSEAWKGRARLLLDLSEEAPPNYLAVEFPFRPAGLSIPRGELVGVTNELGRLVARGERLTVACVNEAERERLSELLGDAGLATARSEGLRGLDEPPGVSLVLSNLEGGVRHPSAWLVPSSFLFVRHVRGENRVRINKHSGTRATTVESFTDLEVGSFVVHVSHGIGRFAGVVQRERDGQVRDLLHIEYADDGALYVPTDRIGLVRRWVGPTSRAPRLSKLGTTGWRKKTQRASEAVRDLAADLLEVHAERLVRPGYAYPPDDRWQVLFEESFPYTDTPDQVQVTAEVKADMISARSMDRVVCGDVGYGKTEIAIRAAFKAANAGRQVAVLCPTTVLAHQHDRSFKERMAPYPIVVEVLSRFRTPAEVRDVLKRTKRGDVDVLIGTHRILSKDVEFKDLGLVVIDEEQRFGVAHKEQLKGLRRQVEVLTLTATPIPRTLHMALSGARDISVIQTPPPGRSPIQSTVTRFSEELIKHAIERELARDGQVFFVHDRIRTLQGRADLVRRLVPDCRIGVVHGQMPPRQIESRMKAFFRHETDVLVATTLIENGLDVRRANTLILDRADQHGLAELHQIRGRVGRSDVPAYAYFLVEPGRVSSDAALKRLRAIEEFTDLGAGFQIAMRDLEIRGAGNVLGAEQSGHVVSVGYDLYCRLLKRAVAELRGELRGGDLSLEQDLDLEAAEVEVTLRVTAFVPTAFVEDAALKIELYRKLASCSNEGALDALILELRDRFGVLPRVLDNLLMLRRVRLRAAAHGVIEINRADKVLRLRCRSAKRLEGAIRKWKHHIRPIDTHMLYVRMETPRGSDEDQLAYLLELLPPVAAVKRQTVEKARGIDPEVVRAERQRRLRAREARAAQEKEAQKHARPTGARRKSSTQGRRGRK
ncbi:MAG: transcription-repair coupling factor [Planctomycetes bacterium]|nr:transcription-repair coupling factor [Planctomycetota bacterium]